MTNQQVCFLFMLFCLFSFGNARNKIKIAGIFDSDYDDQELMFRYAAEKVKQNKTLHLSPETARITPDDDFQASRTVCSFLSNGVVGIFGPNSRTTSQYIQSLCDTKEIPHIDTRWNYKQERGSSLINLYPYPPVLARVYAEIVKLYDWKSFTILYEDDYSLPRINELLKIRDNKNHNRDIVVLKQLDEFKTGNYRPVLMNVKKSGETFFVLDCSIEILSEVLNQALQVGLMTDIYNYIITNLDLHTVDLFPYQHGGANITGVQLINLDDDYVRETIFNYERYKEKHAKALNLDRFIKGELRTETALMYDAVFLYAEAFRHISAPGRVETADLGCNNTSSWRHGSSMINYLKTKSLKKLSGLVKFDYEGFRSDFTLNIIEVTKTGLQNVGTWNSTEGINITRLHATDHVSGGENSLQNKSFVVLIALTEPYNMLKDASAPLSGNNRFEGYGIDLIHKLSVMLGFNYTFVVQEDGNYGNLDQKTGEWNGMVRELMDYRADLAITDLTITSERESAVDFTMPFMNLGISILYKKPMKLPPSLFSFLSPFSHEVWQYLGGAYVAVSLALYVMARISPSEWINRYPCIDEPEFLENQFSIRNSFWFTVGSLMQQGSELAPIAISTRMVAGTWWFFTLIMVSSYTANLAAFLTVESLSSPFKNIDELANKQGIIKFGAKKGGSTANFFRDSNHSTYQKIWNFMEENPQYMTNSNPMGVTRANNEDYAFFMESTTIEYTINRFCNLTQVGGLLDDKGYGIAMRKNSPYRNILSAAVLKLLENGELLRLKHKWWKEKRGGSTCMSITGSSEAQELGMDNVGGVFFVLVVGSAGGFLVGVFEVLVHAFKMSFINKTTFCEQLSVEVKFLLDLKNRVKPIRKQQEQVSPYGFAPEYDNKIEMKSYN